ncbi:MAG TPA: hypothetical protein VLF43_04945 [Candidatus Saccharimonadales bacterium]|nr:hypothetical protein [Candidatus Saccharimonadales bacterium]
MAAHTVQKPNSHIKDLLLLFAVPAGIAVLTAGIVYIPRLFANPTYDFIYSFCNDYRCSTNYSVDDTGSITQRSSNASDAGYYSDRASLRYFDTSDNSSRSLTLQEAKRYQLNTSSKSPDGYTLTKQGSSGGFLFWDNYDEGWYLKNGGKKKSVMLANNNSYYSSDITFLGWVGNEK